MPPGTLGGDVTLDGHAQECFAGVLDACDRLYAESAPFPEYERYASTCGGRVKPFAVAYCTELESGEHPPPAGSGRAPGQCPGATAPLRSATWTPTPLPTGHRPCAPRTPTARPP